MLSLSRTQQQTQAPQLPLLRNTSNTLMTVPKAKAEETAEKGKRRRFRKTIRNGTNHYSAGTAEKGQSKAHVS
jgi:hypothetical protein